jgi:hypothetical protein
MWRRRSMGRRPRADLKVEMEVGEVTSRAWDSQPRLVMAPVVVMSAATTV